MFIFWMILPRLIAAAIMTLHKKLSAAEDPWAEATKIGKQLTQDLRENMEDK